MNKEIKDEIYSVGKDWGEVALDSILKDGLFKDFHVMGTIMSISKIGKSISDQILIRKISFFLKKNY